MHTPPQRKILSSAQAKTRFAEALRLVERGGLVEITRYGQPVAVLVSAEHLEQLERLRGASPQEGLAGLIGRWDDGEDFAAELEQIAASRMPLPAPDIE